MSRENKLLIAIVAACITGIFGIIAALVGKSNSSIIINYPTPSVLEQVSVQSNSPTYSSPEPTIPSGFFNACSSEGLDDNIVALSNNTYQFRDKNQDEITAGDYWFVYVPTGVYGQVFFPITGVTYQVRGPAQLQVGAGTFWCNDLSSANNGEYIIVNSQKLALGQIETIGSWAKIPSISFQPK